MTSQVDIKTEIHLHSLYWLELLGGSHIALSAKFTVCTTQGIEKMRGYLASMLKPTALKLPALSVMI